MSPIAMLKTRLAAAALLAAVMAAPAMAQTPFPCRVGPAAKESYLLAEHFAMVVEASGDRTEYRMRVFNPHPWPAAVLAGIGLPGLRQAPAEPVIVPARGRVEVTIGWFPLSRAERRMMAPPSMDEVRAAMTIPLCEVLGPDAAPAGQPLARSEAPLSPAPLYQAPIPSRGVEVIRDERLHQRLHRL